MTPRSRTFLRTVFVALGITTVCQLWLLAPFVTRTHSLIYHWSGSTLGLFLPPILSFFAFWLTATIVFLLARAPGRVCGALWLGAIASTPWFELRNWAFLTNSKFPHVLGVMLLGLGVIAPLLALVFWRRAFEKKLEPVVSFASTVFLAMGVTGVVALCQIAWFGWNARSLNAELPLHRAVASESTGVERPRIIWIVFDELSHEQVYERRFSGLQLPAFDRLTEQATIFTNVIPAGIQTELVMTALMTGLSVDAVRPSSDEKELALHSATGAWQRFDQHDTVFQDALNLNHKTGVAGWYVPYCRIMPDVLDSCFWTSNTATGNTMFPRGTVRSNMATPWIQFAGERLGRQLAPLVLQGGTIEEFDAKAHIFDYVTLGDAADQILDDRSVGFVLIHLPIPHPGGIYDRVSGQFATEHSSYLDNLALADRFLGHIESRLRQSGQWDSSTIVLMGDHSWRTKLFWKRSSDWRDEEQAASRGGGFDERPAYAVKLPEQRVGTRIDAPFAALNTRSLFQLLLAQRIRSANELSAWVKRTEH
jgi:hypothetical protein